MGLDSLAPVDAVVEATTGAGRAVTQQAAAATPSLAPVENLLPNELNKPIDDLYRAVDKAVGPDPFDLAKPVLLDPDDPILHVASRAAYGPTPSLVHEIRQAGGPRAWLDTQLRPDRIDDSEAESQLADLALVRRTAKDLRDDPLISGGMVARELRVATVLRAAWTRRQLLEVMTQFWSEHFSVSIDSGGVLWHKPWEDRNLIRPEALGSFETLLQSVASSPSMLFYLDQSSSRAPNVNENYARELLELHTVGVSGGYDETDVREAAFAFAGWTIDWQTQKFTFVDHWHDRRALQVMGWSHAGGTTPQRGQSLLRYLAHHPSTAQHLARKLAVRFVSEDPPQALVDRLAASWRQNKTQIVPVLRTLFDSDEFWAARGQRLRRPHEQYVAWLRALQPRIDIRRGWESDGAKQLDWATRRLGQSPFSWPTPDGCPEAASHWSGPALVAERWSAASRLVRNRLRGVEVDVPRMVEGAETVNDAINALAARLTSRRPTAAERQSLAIFAGGGYRPVTDLHPDELEHLAHLVLVLPAVQWR